MLGFNIVATFVPELYVSTYPYCPAPLPVLMNIIIPTYAEDGAVSEPANVMLVVVPACAVLDEAL